jgi:endonuclease/exonuclease/phosphatase family metal-dependent hydrolase
MAVYGPTHDNFETAFLSKLVRTCQQNPLPTLIGGDFNIMRNSKEKDNDRYSDRWPFRFNAVIFRFDLQEIELSRRQFTWVNSLPTPTYEKLDKVLMTTEWEIKYLLVLVHDLDRGVSDHTPLLLDMGNATFTGNNRQFKMELSRFTREDFYTRVVEMWNKSVRGRNSVQRWNKNR